MTVYPGASLLTPLSLVNVLFESVMCSSHYFFAKHEMARISITQRLSQSVLIAVSHFWKGSFMLNLLVALAS